jgi:hypothetical protein
LPVASCQRQARRRGGAEGGAEGRGIGACGDRVRVPPCGLSTSTSTTGGAKGLTARGTLAPPSEEELRGGTQREFGAGVLVLEEGQRGQIYPFDI